MNENFTNANLNGWGKTSGRFESCGAAKGPETHFSAIQRRTRDELSQLCAVKWEGTNELGRDRMARVDQLWEVRWHVSFSHYPGLTQQVWAPRGKGAQVRMLALSVLNVRTTIPQKCEAVPEEGSYLRPIDFCITQR